jgi:nucleotide-binding universal stress UspA family protein
VVDDAVAALMKESRLGYSVVVLGASADLATSSVISPFVDDAVVRTTVPMVVVRLPKGHRDQLPWAFGRAVVPVTGSALSRGSAEVACYLSAAIGTRIHLLYVDTNPSERSLPELSQVVSFLNPSSIGRQILDEMAVTADQVGANHVTELRHAESAGGAILESMTELDADLLVLSAVRRGYGTGTLRLGNTAHYLLTEAAVTTILVVIPEERT